MPGPKRAIGFELPLVKWSLGAWTQAVVVRRGLDRTLALGQGSGCASDAARSSERRPARIETGHCPSVGRDTGRLDPLESAGEKIPGGDKKFVPGGQRRK
jgi:hypothetical protein